MRLVVPDNFCASQNNHIGHSTTFAECSIELEFEIRNNGQARTCMRSMSGSNDVPENHQQDLTRGRSNMAHRNFRNRCNWMSVRFAGRILLGIALCVSLLGHQAIAQEPVLRWNFDEENGDALDSGSGPSANGVLLPGATRTTNTPGGFSKHALDLSTPGTDSWLDGGDAAKVDTLTEFTMTTWLYLNDLNTEQGGSANVRLLAKQGPGNFDGFSWNLNNPLEGDRTPDNFRLGMFIGGDLGFGFGQSTEPMGADEQWAFVAVTYDGSEDIDNMSFYVGDEKTNVVQLGDPLSVFAGQVNSTVDIATVNVGFTDAAPGIDFSADGFQDDVRIYDQVLTLEQIEAVRLANLPPTLLGDFNSDGILDALDIDDLTANVLAATNLPLYDVNDDTLVNQADRQVWVNDLRRTFFGDANLDDEFNSSDLVELFAAGEYEDEKSMNSTWATGDFNGDAEFDSGDLVVAFADGGYEQGPLGDALAVPEPTSLMLLVAGLLAMGHRRRRHSVSVAC